jgi:hypothetical protein
MITVPAWALVLSSLVAGFGLQYLGVILMKWMLREGPWSEMQCPVCLRPHDSEARQLQRWLKASNEDNVRLAAENATMRNGTPPPAEQPR